MQLSVDLNDYKWRIQMMLDEQIILHLYRYEVDLSHKQKKQNLEWLVKHSKGKKIQRQTYQAAPKSNSIKTQTLTYRKQMMEVNVRYRHIILSIVVKFFMIFGFVNYNIGWNNKAFDIILYCDKRYRQIKQWKQAKSVEYNKCKYHLITMRQNLIINHKELNFVDQSNCKVNTLHGEESLLNYHFRRKRSFVHFQQQLTRQQWMIDELQKVSDQLQQAKHTDSKRNGPHGSYDCHFAALIVTLLRKTNLELNDFYAIGNEFYQILKPVCQDLDIIPRLPKSATTLNVWLTVFMRLFRENAFLAIKFWGISFAIDGVRLNGAGARHAVVLEIIGYIADPGLILHFIDDIFYNNEKSIEDGESIMKSVKKYSKNTNYEIIQNIETEFDSYLHDLQVCFEYNSDTATERMTDESAERRTQMSSIMYPSHK